MSCKCKKGMAYAIRLEVVRREGCQDDVTAILDGTCKRCGKTQLAIDTHVDDQGYHLEVYDLVRRVMPKGVPGRSIRASGIDPTYVGEVRAALRGKRGVK